MQLEIFWNKPKPLTKGREYTQIYTCNLKKIPGTSGIYIFARYYDRKYYALYVGQSKNLKNRVKGHLNNLKLMKHLEKAKTGKRVIITGTVVTKGGQNLKKALNILERAFIRHFLSEGHDLVNHQGVKIPSHKIQSRGHIKKSFILSSIYLEKKKGE